MARKDATEEQINLAWGRAISFWDTLEESTLKQPWVEANFKLKIFKLTLAQQGLKLPPRMGIL